MTRRFFSSALPVLVVTATALAGCATVKPPEISYDSTVPSLPAPPAPLVEERPRPLHIPPAWTPSRGGTAARQPTARVQNANAAARVEPRRDGYYNAIQIYPYSEGALYQVYAAPGQITSIALEPGESLTGAGPIAAGDTARWIIGDTTSGAGGTSRVHVLVKPTRADIETNLVINTDRRTYLVELRSGETPYMPSVAWSYPESRTTRTALVPAAPVIPPAVQRNHRYALSGDRPAWRPVSVYDDGRRVYVEFPRGIVQGEMPPLFVIGSNGEPELVNTRIHQNILIVDRLFAAAELRLGAEDQERVRIIRADGRPPR
ncbi:P-type conjugative transfer protein TrbG [Inquilinus sp. CAU 1745]|uniref:P-type conjugative transfer protein TrbG n=1 Tax=Inquilinus sp. CAU 1745 TaxID=3140369 RepID=UPI00325B393F